MARVEHVYGDLDSLCYTSAFQGDWETCKILIRTRMKEIRDQFRLPQEKVTGWVENPDGKDIFRNHVAMQQPYKGNRVGREKPALLRDAKYWLRDNYPVQFATYYESEDYVLIQAHRHGWDRCAIAAIDKDLEQVPAQFYDYSKKLLYTISPDQARKNFYAQVLTGDSTDHILGLKKGVGPKTALKLLEGCDTELQYSRRVGQLYAEEGHSWELMVEMYRLIFILREFGQVYQPLVGKKEYEEMTK